MRGASHTPQANKRDTPCAQPRLAVRGLYGTPEHAAPLHSLNPSAFCRGCVSLMHLET
jgi:hypothetical protein